MDKPSVLLPTPPSSPRTSATQSKGIRAGTTTKHGARDDDTTAAHKGEAPTHRPIRVPLGQKDRPIHSPPKRNFAAEIVIEEDDGTLPHGYVGTHGNFQFIQPSNNNPPAACGTYGHHELACGHWIMDDSQIGDPGLPCGMNCKTPSFGAEPFNCPLCHKIVMDVVDNDLGEAEKQKLEQAKSGGHAMFVVAFITEFVTKRGKMTANITETVISIASGNGYGRKCSEAAAPEPTEYMSPAELLEAVEQSKKWRKFAETNIKAHGQKRKVIGVDPVPALKRVTLTKPVESGKPTWLSPPSHVLGPITRKRSIAMTADIKTDNVARDAKRGRVVPRNVNNDVG